MKKYWMSYARTSGMAWPMGYTSCARIQYMCKNPIAKKDNGNPRIFRMGRFLLNQQKAMPAMSVVVHDAHQEMKNTPILSQLAGLGGNVYTESVAIISTTMA